MWFTACVEKIGEILYKKTKNSSGNRQFTKFRGIAFSQLLVGGIYVKSAAAGFV
jgi:hypothetical protein